MSIVRRYVSNATSVLAEKRQIRSIISSPKRARDGWIIPNEAINLQPFRESPTIFFNHDTDKPVAYSLEETFIGGNLTSLAQFPPAGASQLADEIYNLITAQVIRATSIGFDIIEGPDKDGIIKRCDLVEWSFVGIGALPGAVVTERARAQKGGTVMQRGTVGYYRVMAERMERKMQAEKYEEELRAEGQADARAATRRGGRSTRESRAAMARLYQMDIEYDARELAFESRPTARGYRR